MSNCSNSGFEVVVTKRVLLTEEDIEDIVVTALEGGIGYWACLDNTGDAYENAPDDEPTAITCTKELLAGNTVVFLDEEDWEDGKDTVYELNIEKLLKGVQLWLENSTFDFIDRDGKLNFDMFDAIQADSIIQYALFGEIVFA